MYKIVKLGSVIKLYIILYVGALDVHLPYLRIYVSACNIIIEAVQFFGNNMYTYVRNSERSYRHHDLCL